MFDLKVERAKLKILINSTYGNINNDINNDTYNKLLKRREKITEILKKIELRKEKIKRLLCKIQQIDLKWEIVLFV